MTDDRPGLPDEPDFDDPTHEPISELLAAARVDSPIPAEVAARLDAILAELTGQPRASEPSPVVVPMRRRRRLASRLLAAAAVIVVAGAGAVGLNQVMQGTQGSDDKAASATADSAGSVVPETAAPENAPDVRDGLTGTVTSLDAAGRAIPVLTTAEFSTQSRNLELKALTPLERAVRLADAYDNRARTPAPSYAATDPGAGGTSGQVPPSPSGSVDPQSGDFSSLAASLAKARTCTAPKIEGTRSYPILLDGQPALLVVHPAASGSRLVQAWSCDGSEVLAFTTVPA